MLQRAIDGQLQDFLRSTEKKCLVVRGARQVGKTYSVDQAGLNAESIISYIRINFLESPGLKQIFSGDLDVDSLLLNFSLYLPDREFIPGKTLLFLDEIQECPQAITSLKFWAQDGRFKVVASGSMLGIDYKRPTSYPVGSVTYLDMQPLNFQEFLWAIGVKQPLIETLHTHYTERKKVPDPVHTQMLHYLNLYMILGGMPEVVQTYVDTHNVAAADARQRAILQNYRYDIAHYAPPEMKIRAEACYFSLPDQLSKENHKFQYSIVEKGGNRRKYGSSLDWLLNADLVYSCQNVTKVEYPLRSFAAADNFRLYPGDIGLLIAMYDYSMKAAVLSDSADSSARLGQAKGGLYEALIADLLLKNGHRELYFYKNDTTHTEIEFLLPTSDGVIPVEVKAGNNRSRSLDSVLKKDAIRYGFKLTSGNIGVSGKKITLPLYMAMFL